MNQARTLSSIPEEHSDLEVTSGPRAATRTGNDLVFPEFDDIKVSTKTFTVKTNVDLNIERIAEILPIHEYIVVKKRRGRKKKGPVTDPNKNVPYGSIITVDYMGKIRGVDTKCKCEKPDIRVSTSTEETMNDPALTLIGESQHNPDLCSYCRKKKEKKTQKFFRNSFTVVILFDKRINFKVYRNGTFQMTGCKTHKHAEMCVKYTWDAIKHDLSLYTLRLGTCLDALFVPAMRNIDFDLGFFVDREKLDFFITTETDWYCLLETSFGYTGVNIRIPLKNDITEMVLRNVVLENLDEEWNDGHEVNYQHYLDLLPPKDQKIKLDKNRHNTFLVFQSGRLIMSGSCASFMREMYYEFLGVIRECFDQIEERLDV
jgi:TATA-box binding protein (TBP) (component of TFIID and TFIIIB)